VPACVVISKAWKELGHCHSLEDVEAIDPDDSLLVQLRSDSKETGRDGKEK
jgi:hypothetical protein